MNTVPERTAMSLVDRVILVFKGLLIGMSDSVPGVSGGTVAVVTGLYGRLIEAISAFDLIALRRLGGGDLRGAWRHVDGDFLLTLGVGMLAGLVVSANTVLFALAHYPLPLGAFFVGLVAGALVLLRGEPRLDEPVGGLLFVCGAGLVIALGWLQPASDQVSSVGLFFAGFVAISAMLLPGLSGAFLLILLGVYEPILAAFVSVNVLTLATFAMGCVVGLLVFSRVLRWVLLAHRGAAYSMICGLLLGSLSVIWPWKLPVASGGSRPVLPTAYAAELGVDAQLGLVTAAAVFGFVLVVGLHSAFLSTNKDED